MVIPKEGKHIVVFKAEWCKPCKSYNERLKYFEDLTGGKVVRIDVDENPAIAGSLNVMSVPTTFLVVNGQPISQWLGLQPWEILKDAYDNVTVSEKK